MIVLRVLISIMLSGFIMSCDDGRRANSTRLDVAVSDGVPNDAALSDTIMDAGVPAMRDHVFLLRVLDFAREEDSQSLGFDLDDSVTEQGGISGCGHADFQTPDGHTGIDNQFSQLLPLIEQFGGMAIGVYGRTAIKSGNLMLMIELSDVDSLYNDDAVTMTIYRGLGTPLLGTDDLIEPWQTFDIDVDTHWLTTQNAQITEGVLEVRGLDFTFPFYIFDFVFDITMKDARFEIHLDEEARHDGLLAGSISIENMLQIADNIEGGDMLPGLIRTVGTTLADMDPDADGLCQSLSTTMVFESVGAFFYEDSPRPEAEE